MVSQNPTIKLLPGTGDGDASGEFLANQIPVCKTANINSRVRQRRSKTSAFETVIIPAGGNSRVLTGGTLFTILSANLPVKIKTQPVGRLETYYVGGGAKYSDPFDWIYVENTSATTQLTLLIWIGFTPIVNFAVPMIPVTSIEVMTNIAATGVVQPMSTVDLYFRKGFFYGYSACGNAPVNNAQPVQIGKSKTNQPDTLFSGQVFPYDFPQGQWFNLANVWIFGTINDGVFFSGTQ